MPEIATWYRCRMCGLSFRGPLVGGEAMHYEVMLAATKVRDRVCATWHHECEPNVTCVGDLMGAAPSDCPWLDKKANQPTA